MRKKIILIGRSGSGKSTLTQVMNQQEIEYKKNPNNGIL